MFSGSLGQCRGPGRAKFGVCREMGKLRPKCGVALYSEIRAQELCSKADTQCLFPPGGHMWGTRPTL